MTDEVYVDVDSLRGHKATVQFLADELNEAVEAIAHVTAPSFAYGILCSPILAGPMALVQQDGSSGVRSMHGVMEAIAENLETTACVYEFVDTSTSAGMTRFQTRLS